MYTYFICNIYIYKERQTEREGLLIGIYKTVLCFVVGEGVDLFHPV